MAYYLLLYSLYTYDTFDFIQLNYLAKNKFSKFKFHPFGELLDTCNINKNSNKTLFEYIGLNVTKNFWIQNINYISALNQSKISQPYKDFETLANRIANLTLSEFIHVDPKNINLTIAWDIVNEEQINYFLFEMPKYNQMKIGRNINNLNFKTFNSFRIENKAF